MLQTKNAYKIHVKKHIPNALDLPKENLILKGLTLS
jgi:hypothetical protein